MYESFYFLKIITTYIHVTWIIMLHYCTCIAHNIQTTVYTLACTTHTHVRAHTNRSQLSWNSIQNNTQRYSYFYMSQQIKDRLLFSKLSGRQTNVTAKTLIQNQELHWYWLLQSKFPSQTESAPHLSKEKF